MTSMPEAGKEASGFGCFIMKKGGDSFCPRGRKREGVFGGSEELVGARSRYGRGKKKRVDFILPRWGGEEGGGRTSLSSNFP